MTEIQNLTRELSTEPARRADDVLIHVRHAPNGEINSIDGLPAHLAPRAWLDQLLKGAGDHYRTLAGGRGFFRIPRPCFDSIMKEVEGARS